MDVIHYKIIAVKYYCKNYFIFIIYMSFTPTTLVINSPFSFNYTLTQQEIDDTVTLYPGGFFYIAIVVDNLQFNLGNGTNNQQAYSDINVNYTPGQPLDFPNRSYTTAGNYTFYLLFNIGSPNYYQQAPIYTQVITFNSTPCFNEGTKIISLNKNLQEMYIPIENLRKGDLVKSYKHGYRKIDLICNNQMTNNPEKWNECMYKMEKTEENGLIEDLIVTGGHSILVDDLGIFKEENDKIFGSTIKIDDKYLLLSAISKDFTKLVNTNLYNYYHFTLENNGNDDERFGVWANGILTETPSKNYFLKYIYASL